MVKQYITYSQDRESTRSEISYIYIYLHNEANEYLILNIVRFSKSFSQRSSNRSSGVLKTITTIPQRHEPLLFHGMRMDWREIPGKAN